MPPFSPSGENGGIPLVVASLDQKSRSAQMVQELLHIRPGRGLIDLIFVQHSTDQAVLGLLGPELLEQELADLIQSDDPGEGLSGLAGGDRDHLIQDPANYGRINLEACP